MTKPIQADQLNPITVDCNNPETRELADMLVKEMIGRVGLAHSISLFVLGTIRILSALLHTETPMPEVNISSCDQMLTQMRESIMSHAECARRINGVGKKETVN